MMKNIQALSGRLQVALDRFASDRSGATSIEYAMIAAGIAVAVIVSVTSLGTKVGLTYADIDTHYK